jgi:hypothetical protein
LEFGTSAKSISIGGDLLGTGSFGGSLHVGTASSVVIGGSMVGLAGTFGSGRFSADSVGSITIGHDLRSNTTSAGSNGTIVLNGSLGALKIGGSIIIGDSGGTSNDPVVSVVGGIGSIRVGGSITGWSERPASITATGLAVAAGTPAIKSLVVKHAVERAKIVTGYSASVAVNTDAGIGSIAIGGYLTGTQIDIGSSIGGDGTAGTADDGLIPTSLARLDSIKIGGTLTGIGGDSTTYYVQAPVIKRATIGKAVLSGAQLHGYVDFNAIGGLA